MLTTRNRIIQNINLRRPTDPETGMPTGDFDTVEVFYTYRVTTDDGEVVEQLVQKDVKLTADEKTRMKSFLAGIKARLT